MNGVTVTRDYPAKGYRATRKDAPVPDEHIERPENAADDSDVHHPAWVPHTTAQAYITGQHAMNLRSSELGPTGDWHQSCWTIPVRHGTGPHIHSVFTSDTEPYCNHIGPLFRLFGEREIVDARSALATIGHPAAMRSHPVHCATHVRAVIEMAWRTLNAALWDSEEQLGQAMVKTHDPWTIARWLRSPAEWQRFHTMAREVRDALIENSTRQGAWEYWRHRQCPTAHVCLPDERWRGA